MATGTMKRLILQTYVKDDIKRDTLTTYKSFPKLERISRKQFERYAELHGADYEFFTGNEKYNTAHWARMVMFDRDDYDEVLYVDCDILINPRQMTDNIFDHEGSFVHKIWAYPFCLQVDTEIEYPNHPSGDFNAGVMKMSRRELDLMRDEIDTYYHDTHNQDSLNLCYRKHVGKWKALPYRFNVTHRPTDIITFRHYAGLHKTKDRLSKDPIWRMLK